VELNEACAPRRRWSRWSGVGLGSLLCGLALGLAGCAGPENLTGGDLFAATAANYGAPVMLSRAPTEARGRPIEARSQKTGEFTSTTATAGNASVTVTTEYHEASDLGASRKLLGQTNRSERWLQIEEIVFQATNAASLGHGAYERTLLIRAEAHR
jgi:hypothetical protein